MKESSLPKFNNIQYAFKFANNCDANHKDSAIILGDRFFVIALSKKPARLSLFSSRVAMIEL
ncbi:hypothetical protein LLS47_16985 [Rouxiella badensis]|uniref:hypothetical protein n=1 Tax=Rouxiella badensis TaxID=1646377 RepID=UPI001D13A5A3|nr:hypothetical protein [Rouxiella badensis]MCC3721147.1 hypothetical protein [Rouxiella badensis]MCC3730958.1 hypothetical protein [Rouxiella badensis]MCC3734631.1 hypothetical protein [Rouxiella badensis]MCC3742384.1 hypothetical protein [Rouxiella badensis]MCC3760104.1 hypothetical protein [Rouxiella badensis]